MSMNKDVRLIDLGHCMAKINIDQYTLIIASPPDFCDGLFLPGEYIQIAGGLELFALRDALNEAFPVEGGDQ